MHSIVPDDLGEFFHSDSFQKWWNSDNHRDQVDDEYSCNLCSQTFATHEEEEVHYRESHASEVAAIRAEVDYFDGG